MQEHPRFDVAWGRSPTRPWSAKLVLGPDIVYHLAAAVGVQLILDRPVETIETNIVGTEMVLRAACETRPRVVIASTSEVYGKNDRVPLSEEDDRLLGPTTKSRWSYACSKAIDEFLALAYHREHQLPVTIVRFFNTIGPRQTGRYGMVVPRFVRQALDGQADHRLRRRAPVSMLHRRGGRGARHHRAVAGTRRDRRGVQRRHHARGDDRLPSPSACGRSPDSDSPIVLVPYDEAYQPGFEDLRRRVPDIGKVERAIGYRPRVSARREPRGA